MKKFLLLLLLPVVLLSGCEKSKTEAGLPGTTWTYITNDVCMELKFIDGKTCTILSGRAGLYGANKMTYDYELGYGVDIFLFIQGTHLPVITGNWKDARALVLTFEADGPGEFVYTFTKQ